MLAGLIGGSIAGGINTHVADAKQRIVVIHSYHDQLPWTQGLRTGINKGFEEQTNVDVEIFHEFLDAKRFPKHQHGKNFLQQLTLKYQDQPVDLLMVSDDPALKLVLKYRTSFFTDRPIVYLGINKVETRLLNTPNITGVFEIHSAAETVFGALQQTKSQHLIILNDTTETGLANLGRIETFKKHPGAPSNIILLNDLTPEEIETKFSSYPKYWPVLLLGQLRRENSSGALINFKETAQLLRKKTPNPLYTASTTFLGHGVVGGKILDAEYHAQQSVDLAGQVLSGKNISNIPPITKAKTRWIFDQKELRRFRFSTSSLPKGSKVINQEQSFYEQYKSLVWLTLGAFIVTLLLIFLLMEVIRKREIEEKLLREDEKRYRDLAEAGANIFWELDSELVFTYASGDTQALNVSSPIQLLGQSLQSVVAEDSNFEFDWDRFLQFYEAQQPIQDFIFHIHDGKDSIRIFKLNGKPIIDFKKDLQGYRGILREITKEYHISEKLAYQATYDWLTGLVNRYEFNVRLQEIIQHCHSPGMQAVLCYIDLDQFKIVNDTAGHLAGDRLLVELADEIQASIRESDILGRLGGDEFGLILEACSLQTAQEICDALITRLQAYRFQWNERQFTVGCSIGVVPILNSSVNMVDLLSRADLACYKAKDLGRGRVYIDTPGALDLTSDQHVMTRIANLTQSLEENQFFLVKQKIQSLSMASVAEDHFEVLLRFRDKTGGIMTPGEFVPAMERYGVISIVDRWVLETVLQGLKNLDGDAVFSINISGVSLSDERFLEHAVRLIDESNIPGTRLCFEITETAAISHLEEAQRFMQTMKSLGVKFALDDFGSGLASFGYLKTLPVDRLKIDGSLVKDMVRDPSNLAIVEFINDLAHMMGMQTVAEFVEDGQTLKSLQTLGIDYAQGYHIGKPEPIQFTSDSIHFGHSIDLLHE